MEDIARIIYILSKVYNIDKEKFVTKKLEAEKYGVGYRMAAYFCYDYILNAETDLTLYDLTVLLCCSKKYILNAHARTVVALNDKHLCSNEARAVNFLINGLSEDEGKIVLS